MDFLVDYTEKNNNFGTQVVHADSLETLITYLREQYPDWDIEFIEEL